VREPAREVELEKPDLAPHGSGNCSIPGLWTFESGRPGPHVAVTGLTHGNEPCGAWAISRLLSAAIRPACGRLSLALVNLDAYRYFQPGLEAHTRFLDRDMNRLWRDDWIDEDDASREAARARELRPWLRTVDYLLDLHSTWHVARPFFVLADIAKTRALADAMAWPVTQQVMPGGCAEGRHLIDYGRFSDPGDPAVALTVECGRHFARDAAEAAWWAALRFLVVTGVLPEPEGAALGAPAPSGSLSRWRTHAPHVVAGEDFELLRGWDGFEPVTAGNAIGRDGGADIVAPVDGVVLSPRPRPRPGEVAFYWGVSADRL
jgi:predicted deacylase